MHIFVVECHFLNFFAVLLNDNFIVSIIQNNFKTLCNNNLLGIGFQTKLEMYSFSMMCI